MPEPPGAAPIVRHAVATDLEHVKPLWEALYRHQVEHGMLLAMPAEAYVAWEKSILTMLGRFAVLVVAEREGQLVGFVAGRVRTLPPYFGSAVIGTLSEVFVDQAHRTAGIGRQLVALAIEWFGARQITRVELQVVAGNPDAIRFYRQLGWREELLQLVWDPGAPGAPGNVSVTSQA
jgi:GNAT superfamily N-acetyltransferase